MNAARKKVEPLDDLWMSQPKAAAELGCSRHGVLAHIASGELTADLVAGRTVVSRASVAALKEKLTAKREQEAVAPAV